MQGQIGGQEKCCSVTGQQRRTKQGRTQYMCREEARQQGGRRYIGECGEAGRDGATWGQVRRYGQVEEALRFRTCYSTRYRGRGRARQARRRDKVNTGR